MKLLPLDQLGPHELLNNRVRFGFLLPWVSATNGNALFVKVIHEADQFLATNLKWDTFRHFGSIAIPQSTKI